MDTDLSHLSRLLRSKDRKVQFFGGAIAFFALLPAVLGPIESPELNKLARVAQNIAWVGITLTALAARPEEREEMGDRGSPSFPPDNPKDTPPDAIP